MFSVLGDHTTVRLVTRASPLRQYSVSLSSGAVYYDNPRFPMNPFNGCDFPHHSTLEGAEMTKMTNSARERAEESSASRVEARPTNPSAARVTSSAGTDKIVWATRPFEASQGARNGSGRIAKSKHTYHLEPHPPPSCLSRSFLPARYTAVSSQSTSSRSAFPALRPACRVRDIARAGKAVCRPRRPRVRPFRRSWPRVRALQQQPRCRPSRHTHHRLV